MRSRRIKQAVLLLAIAFVLAIAVLALAISADQPPKVIGSLPAADIDAIRQIHRAKNPLMLSKTLPAWLPAFLRHRISGLLNPIETIAVPGSEHAVIVYRGYENYYYDKKGAHRWGHATYDLYKGPNGWYAPGGPSSTPTALPGSIFTQILSNQSSPNLKTISLMTPNGPVQIYSNPAIPPTRSNSAPFIWGTGKARTVNR